MISKTSKFSVISGPPVVDAARAVAMDTVKKTRLGERYERCQDCFETIFIDISNEKACKASLGDRKIMMKGKDTTLTYGELDTMEPIWKVLSRLFSEHGLHNDFVPQSDRPWKYYDLGSGSGRPVVAAALALRDHLHFNGTVVSRLVECIGIELLPSLYELSTQAKDSWYNSPISHDIAFSSDNGSSGDTDVDVEFILGSIFDLNICNWTDGDFIFINSTCFDVNMLLRLYDIAARLRKGAVLVTLSRSMVEIGALARNIRDQRVSEEVGPPVWQLLFETREVMSW